MITFPADITIFCLIVMIGIAFLPPKIPTFLRNILIQIAFGVFIYFTLFGATFELPNAEHLPMSGLFGGYIDASLPLYNKLAFGLLAPVVGIVFSLLVGFIRFVFNRRKQSDDDK